MIFLLLLALVSANHLIKDHFPTPLYLQTPQGQFINLQEHLIMPDVPLHNLWKYRFALPILMQAYPGSQLRNTADYDQSLLADIRDEFKRPTIGSDLQHPFGRVPHGKLVAAQERMMLDWKAINELLKSPLKYDTNAKFREMVDRFGLLQVICNLEDWQDIIPDEVEDLPQLPTGFAILNIMATEMHHKGQPEPNPFYATLVWEPCSRYRSPVTQLDCWAKIDTESTSIPDLLSNVIKYAEVYHLSSVHLSLEASRRLMRLRDWGVQLLLLAKGHPDTFVGSDYLNLDVGLDLSAHAQGMLTSFNVEELADYLLQTVLSFNERVFLVRRLISLVMEQPSRTAATEMKLIEVFIREYNKLWPLFFSFRPLHPIDYQETHQFFYIRPLYEAAAWLASDDQPHWMALRSVDYDNWLLESRNLLVMAHWGVRLPQPVRLPYFSDVESPDSRELIYMAAIQSNWSPEMIRDLLFAIASRDYGLPNQAIVPAHDQALFAHVLFMDPRPLVSLVQRRGWDWLEAPISREYYFLTMLPESQRALVHSYFVSLLNRSSINGPALIRRMRWLNWHLSMKRESLVLMTGDRFLQEDMVPVDGFSPFIFWFQAGQDPKLITRGNLSHLLPEPSLVHSILKHSSYLSAQACDIAERLIGELSSPYRWLTPSDNFAIRLAMVWLPAAEENNDRLAKFLERLESFHRSSFFATLGRFFTPQALKGQYQQYIDNLHLILSHRLALNPPLQRVVRKYHVPTRVSMQINDGSDQADDGDNSGQGGVKRERNDLQEPNKRQKIEHQ